MVFSARYICCFLSIGVIILTVSCIGVEETDDLFAPTPVISPTTKAKPHSTLSARTPFTLTHISILSDQYIAASTGRTIVVWDMNTGKVRHRLKGHSNVIDTVATNGQYLASSAYWRNNIRIWDVVTGKLVRTLQFKYHSFGSFAFDPTGKILATCCYPIVSSGSQAEVEGVRLWDVSTGRKVVDLRSNCRSVAFCPKGAYVVTGHEDGSARFWDLKTQKSIVKFVAHNKPVCELVFRADGQLILSAAARDPKCKIWRVSQLMQSQKTNTAPKLSHEINLQFFKKSPSLSVFNCSWSPDGKYIAIACTDGGQRTDEYHNISLWDAATGKQLANLGNGPNGYSGTSVAFSRNGKLLATTHQNGVLHLWEVSDLLK